MYFSLLNSKVLEQITIKAKPKTDELMLIVMDKSGQEKNLSLPLQNKNEQLKVADLFQTGYNAIFKDRDKNIEM